MCWEAIPTRGREEITEEEIRDLVAAQSSFTPHQRSIMKGAFEVADRRLLEVLRPRPSVFVIDADDDCGQARRALAASGHSRAPVCAQGDLDEVVGVVHLRDLLADDHVPVRQIAAPAASSPKPPASCRPCREMQREKSQMLIVINEHGGVEGIVTVEDLVEELVGEIYDETDRDILAVTRDVDGTLIVPGAFPVHDMVDLGIDVPSGKYATLAGFVLAQLQKVPDEPGDQVDHDGWRFTVSGIEGRAISEIQVRPVPGGPIPS